MNILMKKTIFIISILIFLTFPLNVMASNISIDARWTISCSYSQFDTTTRINGNNVTATLYKGNDTADWYASYSLGDYYRLDENASPPTNLFGKTGFDCYGEEMYGYTPYARIDLVGKNIVTGESKTLRYGWNQTLSVSDFNNFAFNSIQLHYWRSIGSGGGSGRIYSNATFYKYVPDTTLPNTGVRPAGQPHTQYTNAADGNTIRYHTVQGSDTGSGIEGVYWWGHREGIEAQWYTNALKGNVWNDGVAGYDSFIDIPIRGEGRYFYRAHARDNAGNGHGVNGWSNAVDAYWIVDRTAPTGSININNGATYAGVTNVNLNLSATDTLSGVAQMQFSNNNINWSALEPYATVKSNWVMSSGDGTKTVYVRYRDNAGNVSTYSDTIILDTTAPTAPTFSTTPTAATNGNVTVTITYTADTSIKQYKLGIGGTWTAYTTPVTVTANNTVYARGTDLAGNTSAESSINITNIDRVAPTATVIYSTTALTNQNVVATITPSEPVTITNNGGLDTYTFSENGTFTFTFIDAAGNTGSVVVAVNNIDKTPPIAPTFIASTINATNQDVTVTITYPEDANIKEYKIGTDGPWILYTGYLTIASNKTIHAKGTDLAGNTSTESSINIINIDKTSPTATVSYNISIATNQNVVATITPSEPVTITSEGGLSTHTFTENGTFTFTFIDTAGNTGSVAAVVNNIDKNAPTAPTFEVDTTLPAEKVIVIIKYPDDAAVKQYKKSTGEWESYIGSLEIVNNCTIYAKCYDLAGNVSTEASITLYNIEKDGSVEGIELDDRKYFRYYLGLASNNVTQCMLVAGNHNGEVIKNFVRDDVIDSSTNRFKDNIFYIDIYGKIKRY